MSERKEIKLSVSALRKMKFIFKPKEQTKILNQASFYKSVYNGVNDNEIIEAVINKHIKQKIFKIVFMEDEAKIREFNKNLKDCLEVEEIPIII